jgi:hypothetical protein
LLGEHDGAGPADRVGEGAVVERHAGIVEDNVEDDGRERFGLVEVG